MALPTFRRTALFARLLARLRGPRRTLLVGAKGIPLQEFLSTPADKWMR
jgi:hypothetical protein